MQADALLWIVLPLLVGGGSALVSFYITRSRADAALAKATEALKSARAANKSQKAAFQERIKVVEESARRAAMDEFMRDFRIEERSYQRESNTGSGRKIMVLEERLYFRNIPLSNWMGREMAAEAGADLEQLPQAGSPSAGEPDLRQSLVRGAEGVVVIPVNSHHRSR